MRRRPSEEESGGSPELGLPQNSALTVEGRVERASSLADHAVRVRDGLERPLRRSQFGAGLWLNAGAFGLLLVIFVALYFLG